MEYLRSLKLIFEIEEEEIIIDIVFGLSRTALLKHCVCGKRTDPHYHVIPMRSPQYVGINVHACIYVICV